MTKATTGTVYVLVDPRNNSVRYVGATTKPLKDRLSGHLGRASRRVKAWIDELAVNDLKPRIEPVTEGVPEAELRDAERAEITRRLIKGEALLNESATAPARRFIERRREQERTERERAAWEHVARQVRTIVGGPLPPGGIPPIPLPHRAVEAYHALIRLEDEPELEVIPNIDRHLSKETRLRLGQEKASKILWSSVQLVWGHLRGTADQSFDYLLASRVRSVFNGRWEDLEDAARYLALLPWGMVAVGPWAALAERAGMDASGEAFINWVSDDPTVREALTVLLRNGGRMGRLSALDDSDFYLRPSAGLVVMTAAHHPEFDLPGALHLPVKAFLDSMLKGRQLTPAMADLLHEIDPRALDNFLGPDFVSGIDTQLGLPPGTSCSVLTALLEVAGKRRSLEGLDHIVARAAGVFPTVATPDFSNWMGSTAPMFQAVAATLTAAGVLPAPSGKAPAERVNEVRALWRPNLGELERTA